MKKLVVSKPPRKKVEAEESLVKTPQAGGDAINQEKETAKLLGPKKTHVWTKQTTQTGKEEERDSEKVGVTAASLSFYYRRRINNEETPKVLEREQEDVIKSPAAQQVKTKKELVKTPQAGVSITN